MIRPVFIVDMDEVHEADRGLYIAVVGGFQLDRAAATEQDRQTAAQEAQEAARRGQEAARKEQAYVSASVRQAALRAGVLPHFAQAVTALLLEELRPELDRSVAAACVPNHPVLGWCGVDAAVSHWAASAEGLPFTSPLKRTRP